MKTQILLVDDHEMIRDAIKFYFADDPDYEINYEASNGLEALEILATEKVDLVLTDINMPEMDGIELMKSIRKNHSHLYVMVLSMFNEASYINKMISLGANGYILKNTGKNEMKMAFDKIMQGQDYYTQEVYKTIVDSIAQKETKQRLTLETPLTDREKEILVMIANEHSNKEIADKLYISVRTVESHKRNLLEKTGCKNVAGLVMYAVERGII
ncbi:response regulator [Marinoscillum sp. MHG1-6]|uniref:response regulator transcription factor n=1 Tax=Marinoscillum sp. MHG1-6 TaxID=2959627 RepID=UPI002158291E|nr:response regulator transcription factor [Marinoscillum sp. MHG1-6]